MVRAFAGDSTITSGLGTLSPLVALASSGSCGDDRQSRRRREILVVLGTKGPTGGSRPHRGATNGASVSNIPHGVASAFPALPCPGSPPGAFLSIVSSHAVGGTEPRSPGSLGIVRPVGNDRALSHHLRRDRVADRVLPPR